MSDRQQIDPAKVVAMIVAMRPSTIDEAATRDALGTSAATSLTTVARAFGVSYATVKHTWRPAGMPGDGRKRSYPWADVVIWWANRNIAAAESRARGGANGHAYSPETRKELESIELESARADLQIRQSKAARLTGEWVPLVAVQQVLRGMLNIMRDAFLTIPRKWNPRFPIKYAGEWTVELEGDIRGVLTVLADFDGDAIIERCNDDDTRTV
jgi:hypothetical protein